MFAGDPLALANDVVFARTLNVWMLWCRCSFAVAAAIRYCFSGLQGSHGIRCHYTGFCSRQRSPKLPLSRGFPHLKLID